MPATDYTDLYNISERFEEAALDLIAAEGVQAFGNYPTDKMPLDRAEVRFELGQATGDMVQIPGTDLIEHFRYVGCVLNIDVTWDRMNNEPTDGTALREINRVASILRATFRYSAWPFDDTNLLYYRVHRLIPAGETRGFDQSRNCDVLSMRWQIDFEILSDAWPVAAP